MYNNNNNNEVFYTSNTLPKIKIPQKIIELLENSKLQNNFQNFKKNLKECIINIFLLSAKINESIYFKNPNSSFNTKNIKIEDYINNLFKKFDIQSEQYIMPSLNLLDKKILILNIIKYYYYVLYYIYLNNYDNNITRQLIRRYITEYLILNMNQDNIGKIIIYYVYAYVLDYDKNITNKDLFIKFIQNQLENYKQFSSLRLNNKFNEKYKKNSSFNNIVSKENNNSSKVKPNSLLQNSLNSLYRLSNLAGFDTTAITYNISSSVVLFVEINSSSLSETYSELQLLYSLILSLIDKIFDISFLYLI